MSVIWESANWTRQFGIRQTGNRQFGMLPREKGGGEEETKSMPHAPVP